MILRTSIRLLLATAALACSDVGPVDPHVERAGPYLLHSINGVQPPVEVATTDEGTFTVTTGVLTLRSDRTFTETWTGRVDAPGAEPIFGAISASGTYEIRGEDVTFNLPAAPGRDEVTVVGLLRADTLMYAVAGRVILYLD